MLTSYRNDDGLDIILQHHETSIWQKKQPQNKKKTKQKKTNKQADKNQKQKQPTKQTNKQRNANILRI